MRSFVFGFLVAMLLAPTSAEIRAANVTDAAAGGAKEAATIAHPYAGLDQKAFWQATDRDRRSPTEMPGVTGSTEHPSPHGPKHSAAEAKPGARARAPFDEPEILCPATGCGYAPDVVLMKLKPDAELLVSAGRASFTSDALNSLLSENGLDLAEPVFSGVARPRAGSQILRPDGQMTEAPDLTRWVRLRSSAAAGGQGRDVREIARRLQLLPEVAHAEPDYQYKPQGGPDSRTAAAKVAASGVVTVNDPLYPQQWQHTGANVAAAWSHLQSLGLPPYGSPDVVVAVIDTGVDYTHPDLVASMWINQAELNGAPGVDDDANGYVDDLHGARVIAGDLSGNPQDDHGHGTHVAGIIAAQANNGIGGAGVAPGVRIMAIKAAQYSGTLNSSDVARGLIYAAAQGADVINMSFGGYARSLLVEDALATAFGTSVLVAAAGNDGRLNLPCPNGVNFYPASYIYVLGVMSRDPNPRADGGFLSNFSNRDCVVGDSQEYDLMAPGGAILSTLPQGGHGIFSGTSMAAPVVAGIAALARTKWSNRTQYSSRFIMGQIASTGTILSAYWPPGGVPVAFRQLDAELALTSIPRPDPAYLEHWLFDTTSVAPGNDADGVIDAGETIDLGLVIANRWGQGSNVQVSIEARANGSPLNDPNVEWLIDSVGYGSIGAFAVKDNGLIRDAAGAVIGVSTPFRFQVLPGTPNDHVIPLQVTVTAQNAFDPGQPSVVKVSRFTLLVQRGREVPRLIASDFTMTKDDFWLIPDGILVEAGATLRIQPGTQVQFFSTDPAGPFYVQPRAQIQVEGTLLIEGSATEPVELFTGLLYPAHPIIIRAPNAGRVDIRHARIMNPRLGSGGDLDNSSGIAPLSSIEKSTFMQGVSECMQSFKWSDVPPTWNLECLSYPRVIAYKVADSRFIGLAGFRGGLNTVFSQHVIVGPALSLQQSLVDRTVIIDADIAATGTVFIKGSYLGSISGVRKTTLRPSFGYFPASFLRDAFATDGLGSRFSLVSRSHPVGSPQQAIAHLNAAQRLAVELGGNTAWIADNAENAFVGSGWLQAVNQSQFENQYGSMDCGATLLNGPVSCWSLFDPGRVEFGALAPLVNGPFAWLSGQPFSFSNFYAGSNSLGRILALDAQASPFWYRLDTGAAGPVALRLPMTVSSVQFDAARQSLISAGDFGGFSGNAILNDWLSLNSDSLMDVITVRPRNHMVPIAGNYWGTQSTTLIEAALRDFNDDFNLARMQYQPILTTAPEGAYPFVADIIVANANGPTGQVGAEDITITVQFNRDMDTTRPLEVTFGPAEPYSDYVVDGSWVNARTWSGPFLISPITGDGYQYLRVVRGVAAGAPWLEIGNDVGRFRFEVVTSGAASINLQATGAEGRVELTWSQNDYPLLAGYNLYRSNSVAGNYQRINTTTIPQGMTQWTDTAVTSGQPYFYYFTVVLTDLTESPPSNIATATPTDTVPPEIAHTPVHSAAPFLPLTLRANVTDNVSLQSVRLFHRPLGGSSYAARDMIPTTGSEYAATLEGNLLVSPGVEYYIEASDGVSVARAGRPDLPIQVLVQDRPTVTSVQPTSGPAAGGTTITITGTNFKVGAVVDVGAGACASVQRINATQLTCITPSSFPQTVDVRVRNPDAQQGTMLNAYSYLANTASIGFPAASGGNLQIVQVPLNVAGVQGLTSASVSVSFDPAILSARGASAGSLTPGWQLAANTQTPGTVLLSMASAGGPVSGAGTLAVIEFDVVGQPGSNSALTIPSASFNDGAIPVQTSPGSFAVNLVYSVSGSVLYWSAARPVPATQLTLAGTATFNGSSDATGTYSINGTAAGNYTLTPQKPSADGIGISAFDASLALRHDAQLATLTGPALTAADVNQNGQVTAQDAFLILQHAAGLTTLPFPGAGQVWFFDPASRSISGLSGNLGGQSFTGILLGDPSGNWTAATTAQDQSNSGIAAKGTATALSLPAANALPGQLIDVPVSVQPGFGALVLSADLEMNFDPAVLTFVQASAGTVAVNWAVVANHGPGGRLRIAMAGANPLASAGALLVLRFQAIGAVGSQSTLAWQRSELNEGALPSSAASGSVTVALPNGIFVNGFENPLQPLGD